MISSIADLPEVYKWYKLVLSNGWEHSVNGVTKMNILNSKSQFIELQDGNTVNRAYIVQFKYEYEQTRSDFFALSEEKRASILKGELQ